MENLEQIIQDAEDNFENARFEDAHAHFSSISRKFLEQGKIDNCMYFGYRSLLCLQLLKEDYTQWKEIGILGLNLLKISLKEIGKNLDEEKDPRMMKKLLQLQLNLIESSDFTAYKPQIIELITNSLETILEEPNLEIKTRINLLDELVNFQGNSQKNFSSYQEQLVNLLVNEADRLENDELSIFPKLQMYNQALKLCENREQIEELTKKIDDLNSIINEEI